MQTTGLDDPLDTTRLHVATVGGYRTRYYDSGGPGDPLVLLHGGEYASPWSLDCWSLNLPGLGRHFRVIAPDLLGQGHTDAPTVEDDFNFASQVAHVERLLEHIGVTSAHLVGHSRGGLPGAWLALHRPELVRSLVIVDSGTLAPHRPGGPTTRAFYEELLRRIPPGGPTARGMAIRLSAYLARPEQVGTAWIDRALEIERLAKTAEARRHMLAQGGGPAGGARVWLPSLNLARDHVWALLERRGLSTPTLVVWGRDDASAPLTGGHDLVDLLARRTPRVEMHVFTRAGHLCFRDQVDGFDRVVTSFCAH